MLIYKRNSLKNVEIKNKEKKKTILEEREVSILGYYDNHGHPKRRLRKVDHNRDLILFA
jgi:hypothetical protein